MNTQGELTVRRATFEDPRDIGELATLRFAWRARERGEQSMSESEFTSAFALWLREHRESHVGFIGSLGTEPVAMAWLALVDRVPGPGVFERRCAYVQSVFVTAHYRSAGYGSAIMSVLIDDARELRLDYLAVHPSAESFNFYRRLGFEETNSVLELDFRSDRA